MSYAFSQRNQMTSDIKKGRICNYFMKPVDEECLADVNRIKSVLKTADASLLLISNCLTHGGIAYIDQTLLPFAMATHGYAKYDTEEFILFPHFILIHFFRGAYVFFHELAHIFGAQHDMKTTREDKERVPYEYGFGSLFKKGAEPKQGFRTVLA